jgi:hypothetical protein
MIGKPHGYSEGEETKGPSQAENTRIFEEMAKVMID